MIRPVAALLMPLLAVAATLVPAAASATGPLELAVPGVQAVPLGPDDAAISRYRSLPKPEARSTRPSRSSARLAPTDSFAVTITSVRPATLPRSGNVTLTGTVTNQSDQVLNGLNIHPLSSYSPFITASEIAAAAEAAPEITFGGSRLTDPGVLDNSISELGPQASANWRIRIPVEKLKISGGEGVYVLGVQVLSDDADGGRDDLADGRARVFVPRIDADHDATPTSVVVPLRQPVTRTGDGRIEDEASLRRDVAEGGRLRHLVDLLSDADIPMTVVVDPAVLSAVQQLAAGNPERSIAANLSDEEAVKDSEGTSETGQGTVNADAELAQEWLDDAVAALRTHQVLALPYGDLDVAAASRHRKGLLRDAAALSASTLTTLGITSSPVVAPPSGLLPTSAVSSLSESTLLLSTRALPAAFATAPVLPAGLRLGSTEAVLQSDANVGADPNDPSSPVAIRQRVLAEAAVRSLAGAHQPLVVSLPTDLDAGTRAADLLRGLDADFVRLTPLTSVLAGAEIATVKELTYTEHQAEVELDASSFDVAQSIVSNGRALDDVLPLNDTIGDQLETESLTGVSYHSRADQFASMTRMRAANAWIEQRLGQIELSAPSFVILSSDSGPFSLTVRNGLDQPVAFAIRAETTREVEIKAPELIELEPLASRTLNLDARAKNNGVHPVDLLITTPEGVPIGTGDEMNIRSNQVGMVIWVVLGVGAGILFLAIAIRLLKRFRGSRT